MSTGRIHNLTAGQPYAFEVIAFIRYSGGIRMSPGNVDLSDFRNVTTISLEPDGEFYRKLDMIAQCTVDTHP